MDNTKLSKFKLELKLAQRITFFLLLPIYLNLSFNSCSPMINMVRLPEGEIFGA